MKASRVYLRAAELIGEKDDRGVPILFDEYAIILAGGYPSKVGKAFRTKLLRNYRDTFPAFEHYFEDEFSCISLCLMSAIAAWDESHG